VKRCILEKEGGLKSIEKVEEEVEDDNEPARPIRPVKNGSKIQEKLEKQLK